MSATTRKADARWTRSTLFRRHIALPQDHGSWAFIISPLIIGIFAGGSLSGASLLLIVAALGAFLIRQPATITVKIYFGRRSRAELPSAVFWLLVYAASIGVAMAGLMLAGYAALFWLAIPAMAIFTWHLYLVSRRAERRQAGVEIIATGTLALAAPAGYWVGLGSYDPLGWWLWALNWLQAAASIAYVYLRLAQRELSELPDSRTCLRMGTRAAILASSSLIVTLVAGASGFVPRLIWLPFLLQWAETMFGIAHPAIGAKAVRIGVRQLLVTTLFTILFILTWRL